MFAASLALAFSLVAHNFGSVAEDVFGTESSIREGQHPKQPKCFLCFLVVLPINQYDSNTNTAFLQASFTKIRLSLLLPALPVLPFPRVVKTNIGGVDEQRFR